jgi:hypothetical protein
MADKVTRLQVASAQPEPIISKPTDIEGLRERLKKQLDSVASGEAITAGDIENYIRAEQEIDRIDQSEQGLTGVDLEAHQAQWSAKRVELALLLKEYVGISHPGFLQDVAARKEAVSAADMLKQRLESAVVVDEILLTRVFRDAVSGATLDIATSSEPMNGVELVRWKGASFGPRNTYPETLMLFEMLRDACADILANPAKALSQKLAEVRQTNAFIADSMLESEYVGGKDTGTLHDLVAGRCLYAVIAGDHEGNRFRALITTAEEADKGYVVFQCSNEMVALVIFGCRTSKSVFCLQDDLVAFGGGVFSGGTKPTMDALMETWNIEECLELVRSTRSISRRDFRDGYAGDHVIWVKNWIIDKKRPELTVEFAFVVRTKLDPKASSGITFTISNVTSIGRQACPWLEDDYGTSKPGRDMEDFYENKRLAYMFANNYTSAR